MTYQMTNQRYIQSLFVAHVEKNWSIIKKVKKQPKSYLLQNSNLTITQIVFI